MNSFQQWWQHLPSQVDPVLFEIGSFRVQWYGLMYIAAFVTAYLIIGFRSRRETRFRLYDDEFVKSILTYSFIGVLAGGRLGYVLFYNLPYYLQHPLEIILPFRFGADGMQFTGISGMSYHGGIIGVIVACALFTRRYKADFWNLADLLFPAAALGYTFGRLGNFINGELYGRVTDSAVGMYFLSSPDPTLLRHPSQLYEAFFEGIFLFALLWNLRRFTLPKGTMASVYIFGYGFVRFGIEYFREPDAHLGLLALGFSMGQLLCLGMMLVGIGLYIYLSRTQPNMAFVSTPPAAATSAPTAPPSAKKKPKRK